MDPCQPRIPKLNTIPSEWLLLVAREWVFGGNNNKTAAHLTKVLESAAARGDEESGWLLDKMRSKGAIPEFGDDWPAKQRWVAKIMASEDSLFAQYYQGRALRNGNVLKVLSSRPNHKRMPRATVLEPRNTRPKRKSVRRGVVPQVSLELRVTVIVASVQVALSNQT